MGQNLDLSAGRVVRGFVRHAGAMTDLGTWAQQVASWRREVHALYAEVQAEVDPEAAHALWVEGRTELFDTHPASARQPGQQLRHAPYDAAYRFELELQPGERVAIIPEAEIQAIRKAVEGPFRVEPHPFLKCGERVRVTRGSLEGVEGILVRKKNLYRLVLSVDMMAQSVAVEIDATDVEPKTARNFAGTFPARQFAEA